MKLLDKYNRINLISTIIIFLLSAIAFYFALHLTLVNQVDADFEIEKNEILNYTKRNNTLPQPLDVKDQNIVIGKSIKPLVKDVYTTIQNDSGKYKKRQLNFSMQLNGIYYDVAISKSLEGTDNISRAVILITLLTISLILFATFVINRKILKSLWSPFYQSLEKLRHFKIGSTEQIVFPQTNIDEFALLNQTLKRSTEKALQDYNSLRQFTENASHELQTPLAIIRSKMEVLMQGENLSEQQSQAVQGATEAINKLSRLNQSLLLLTKIENEQFGLKEQVGLKKLLENKIESFKEIWQNKQLKVDLQLLPATIFINPSLIELMLNNLFSNATRHNYKGGEITIILTENKLQFINTGGGWALDKSLIFKRFYNPQSNSSSNGLGLAIIKQICDVSHILVEYEYEKNKHVFSVYFS